MSSSRIPCSSNSACRRLISGRYEFTIGQSGRMKTSTMALVAESSQGRKEWPLISINEGFQRVSRNPLAVTGLGGMEAAVGPQPAISANATGSKRQRLTQRHRGAEV